MPIVSVAASLADGQRSFWSVARSKRCEVTAGPAIDAFAARADLAARSCYGHPKQLHAKAQGRLLLRTRSVG